VINSNHKGGVFLDILKTGTLIKELRTEKGFTQKELAEKLNVSTAAVSKWENGKGFPDISILEPLASALDISITELIKGERNDNAGNSDTLAKEIIEISKNEIRFERTRQIFIITAFVLAAIFVNAFVIYDIISGYQRNNVLSLGTPSLIGLFMFLFGGNAIVFGLFNLFMGNKLSVKKSMQIGLFSEACCIASVWLSTVYTSYKVSINDISAILDTAKGIEIYSQILFLTTVLINVIAYHNIVKDK